MRKEGFEQLCEKIDLEKNECRERFFGKKTLNKHLWEKSIWQKSIWENDLEKTIWKNDFWVMCWGSQSALLVTQMTNCGPSKNLMITYFGAELHSDVAVAVALC